MRAPGRHLGVRTHPAHQCGRGGVGASAIAELAVVVTAPSIERTVGPQAQGVVTAGRHHHPVSSEAHLRPVTSLDDRATQTQLTVLVVTSGPEGTIGVNAKRVPITTRKRAMQHLSNGP